MPPTTRTPQRRRQPTRLNQSQTTTRTSEGVTRRTNTRTNPVPDYARDYAYVRQDLIRITLIGGLMMATMIIAAFVI
jgi:hypothetical protein